MPDKLRVRTTRHGYIISAAGDVSTSGWGQTETGTATHSTNRVGTVTWDKIMEPHSSFRHGAQPLGDLCRDERDTAGFLTSAPTVYSSLQQHRHPLLLTSTYDVLLEVLSL